MNGRISAMPTRVHAVRRLVEDEELGVLEERRRDPEALLHPERVGPEAVAGPGGQVDFLDDLRGDARLGNPGVAGEDAQVVAAGQVRIEGRRLDQRAEAAEPFGRSPASRRGRAQHPSWAG